MTVEWQRTADDRLETVENRYPQFKAWQSDNPANNCWLLNIRLSADREPIKIRELQSPEAVEEFVAGFLRDASPRETHEMGPTPF